MQSVSYTHLDVYKRQAQGDAYVSSENELFLLDRIAVDDGSDGIARFEWITGRHAVRAVSSIDSYIYSDSCLLYTSKKWQG